MSVNIPRDQPLSDEHRLRLEQLGDQGTINWIDANYNEPEEADEFEEEVDAEVDYSTWSKTELIDEAKRRGISTTGTVAELKARLEEDDASEEDDDE